MIWQHIMALLFTRPRDYIIFFFLACFFLLAENAITGEDESALLKRAVILSFFAFALAYLSGSTVNRLLTLTYTRSIPYFRIKIFHAYLFILVALQSYPFLILSIEQHVAAALLITLWISLFALVVLIFSQYAFSIAFVIFYFFYDSLLLYPIEYSNEHWSVLVLLHGISYYLLYIIIVKPPEIIAKFKVRPISILNPESRDSSPSTSQQDLSISSKSQSRVYQMNSFLFDLFNGRYWFTSHNMTYKFAQIVIVILLIATPSSLIDVDRLLLDDVIRSNYSEIKHLFFLLFAFFNPATLHKIEQQLRFFWLKVPLNSSRAMARLGQTMFLRQLLLDVAITQICIFILLSYSIESTLLIFHIMLELLILKLLSFVIGVRVYRLDINRWKAPLNFLLCFFTLLAWWQLWDQHYDTGNVFNLLLWGSVFAIALIAMTIRRIGLLVARREPLFINSN